MFGREPQCIGTTGASDFRSCPLQRRLSSLGSDGLELPTPRVCHILNDNASESEPAQREHNHGLKTRTTGK